MSVEVELSKAELIVALKRDCVMALSFYLGEELTLEVPDFHQEIWEELLEIVEKVNQPEFLIGHLQKLFAVPREHSKSTLIKVAVILFMRYSPLRFTLYVSKTATIALNALRDVVNWFQSPQEIELFGAPVREKHNESDGTFIYHIGLGRADGKRKRIILKAIGQGHQARGLLVDSKRPELLILDDIEDYDTADGGTQQKKLDEWTMGSLLKASAKRSVRIFLGNMVRSTTLLARLSRDQEWNPTVFGALVKDKETGELKALWGPKGPDSPGLWTVESLLEDYRRYRKLGMGYIWETELMNLSQDSLLAANLDNMPMVEFVSPEEVESGFIVMDPAFGLNSWNDDTAFTVHVRMKGYPIPILVDHRVGKMTEEQQLDAFLELSYIWNLTTWVIESVAAQRLYFSLFRLLLLDRQMRPEMFLMLPIHGKKEAKASRITAFREIGKSKSYAMAASQIDVKLKLEEYSPTTSAHDDLCDSAAYGPLVWAEHGESVTSRGVQNVVGSLMQGVGIDTGDKGESDVCLY